MFLIEQITTIIEVSIVLNIYCEDNDEFVRPNETISAKTCESEMLASPAANQHPGFPPTQVKH